MGDRVGLIVRNGGKQVGIDWRVFAAAVGVVIALGTLVVHLMAERAAVLNHVARGDVALEQFSDHKFDREIHLEPDERYWLHECVPMLQELIRRVERIERKVDRAAQGG